MIRFDLNNAYGWTLYRQQEVDIHQEQVDIEVVDGTGVLYVTGWAANTLWLPNWSALGLK